MDEKASGVDWSNDEGSEAGFPFLDRGDFPTKRDLETVLALSGKERFNEILNSPDPAELVAQMPAMDVFITLKELGLPDAQELIGLATPEQIIHFLDLDLWRRDRLHPEGIAAWLEMLEACGEEKFQQILEKADPELITAVLLHGLRISKEEDREEDQGKEEEKPGFTLDRVYYVEFRDDGQAPLLTRILKSINHFDPIYYQDLLNRIHGALPAEEEEAALRWRKGRLADRGFPDFFDSLEIYRYLPPESRGESAPSRAPVEEPPWVPPAYLERAGRGSFLFEAAGRGLAEEPLARIKGEMVHLANQVLVAGGADLGEPEAVKAATHRAFQTLDLGLRHLSGEDPDRAGRILEGFPVFRIFQIGFSLGLDLKIRAEALFQKGSWWGEIGGREEFLDSPSKETLRGLFWKHPLLFDPTVPENYRPFRTLAELQKVAGTLKELEVLGQGLSRLSGYSAPEIAALRRRPLYQPDPTLAAVLLAGLAQWVWNGVWEPRPLSLQDLKQIGTRPLEPALGQAWVTALQTRGGLDSLETEVLRSWLALALDRLAEEIDRVPAGNKLDPRYVALLPVEK